MTIKYKLHNAGAAAGFETDAGALPARTPADRREAPLREVDRKVFSVSDLTRSIRFVLEQNFANVWVEGEVANFKWHSSGHMYFSLKDEAAQIQCVMFSRENAKLSFELKDGLAVVAGGRVSVYPVRGQYQLYVERIEPKGVGALQLRFQQLKEKLAKEGLFDEARKREIPYLPARIGVVTSADGAALHDILHVLERRFSNMHVLIYPVPVQGAEAASAIAEAIADMNRWKAADVLIVGRGGGSLEDLWAFNEEVVARAIFDSEIPVISAVGHEVDFTIADFVADRRAATPSAAAEIVLPPREELLETVRDFRIRMAQSLGGLVKINIQRLDELRKDIVSAFGNFFILKKERVSGLLGRLEALGPAATLARGFSVSLKLPGETILRSAAALKIGDRVKTKLAKGFFVSEVRDIRV